MQINMEQLYKRMRIKNRFVREVIAEFLGTYVLLLFGTASVAQVVLGGPEKGTMLSINFCWGIAVTMGVFIAGNVSGGHLNPAVTLALATVGKCSWAKVIPYMLAQYVGAFTASATTFFVYYDAFQGNYVVPDTAGIFATYPGGRWLTPGIAFFDQLVCTGLLMLVIMAITDERNMEVPKYYVPVAVGMLVMAIGMSFVVNCGYAINPARDLGPRLFTFCAGWGKEVFTYGEFVYWWVPIVGPHVGAIVGAWLYLLLIGFHWEPEDEKDEKSIKLETRF